MVPQDIILKIIDAGVAAPSGDNTQPWRFEVKKNSLEIFIPQAYYEQRDEMEYDLFTIYLAHGAMLENIALAADHFGYYADISLFPDTEQKLLTARIELREDRVDHQRDLYRYIAERETRREMYHSEPLTEEQRTALTTLEQCELAQATVRLVEDPKGIKNIARAVAGQIQAIFSEEKIHQFFFGKVRFSIGAAYGLRDGLDVRTLSLSAFEAPLFRYILQHWKVVKLLRHVGIHHVAAAIESLRYRHAAAYCALVGSTTSTVDTINLGRLMERVWLVGTKAGLVMQPTFATFLLRDHTEPGAIGPASRAALITSTGVIERIFHCDEKYPQILLLFRLGKKHLSDKPAVRSLRQEPDIRFV